MSYQIKVITDVATEPVTLAEVKAWCRIDDDYVSDDAQLNLLISSARELLEQETNIGFAPRTLELQWNGCPVEMPYSPTGAITSVKNKDGDTLTTDEYEVSTNQAKSIMVKSACGYDGFEFFYHIDQSVSLWSWPVNNLCADDAYACVYVTGYEAGKLPKSLKQGILTQIDYMFKQQGMPDNSLVSEQALLLAKGYSRNLIL
jgi:hypothetical protein